MEKIEWNEIEDAADELVSIWMHGKDSKWLEHSWKILEKSGMTTFSNEIEKTHVLAYAISLGVLYRDFNAAAYDERKYFEWFDIAEYLGISKFRIAQIIGPDFEPDDYDDDDDLFIQALKKIVESKRPMIIKALYDHYKSQIRIMDSFFRFTDDDSLVFPFGDDEEYIDYNRVEAEMALQWISNGMSSYADVY